MNIVQSSEGKIYNVCSLSEKVRPGDIVFTCKYCGCVFSKRIKVKEGVSCKPDDKRLRKNK